MAVPLVIIESPYASPSRKRFIENFNYLKLCMQDSVDRGEAPFAGHLLYTQFLNDRDPKSRLIGMRLATKWARRADLVAVYVDRGVSSGMQRGIDFARRWGLPVETRSIEGD